MIKFKKNKFFYKKIKFKFKKVFKGENLILQEVWYDGKCKKCGSNVYETGCRGDGCYEAECADYRNACSNEQCGENYWHYVGDQEFADYYEHK